MQTHSPWFLLFQEWRWDVVGERASCWTKVCHSRLWLRKRCACLNLRWQIFEAKMMLEVMFCNTVVVIVQSQHSTSTNFCRNRVRTTDQNRPTSSSSTAPIKTLPPPSTNTVCDKFCLNAINVVCKTLRAYNCYKKRHFFLCYKIWEYLRKRWQQIRNLLINFLSIYYVLVLNIDIVPVFLLIFYFFNGQSNNFNEGHSANSCALERTKYGKWTCERMGTDDQISWCYFGWQHGVVFQVCALEPRLRICCPKVTAGMWSSCKSGQGRCSATCVKVIDESE